VTTPTPHNAPPGAFIVGADGQTGNVLGWRGDWVRVEYADGSSVYGPASDATWRLDDDPARAHDWAQVATAPYGPIWRCTHPGCKADPEVIDPDDPCTGYDPADD
jgi:hypothetical protein